MSIIRSTKLYKIMGIHGGRFMLGTIVNSLAIIIGSLAGLFLKGGIPVSMGDTITKGLGLCIMYIGISGTMKGEDILLLIFSVVIGAVIGEIIDIDKRFTNFGNKVEKLLSKNGESKVAEGFVNASLLFCVGSMAVVGALQSGLEGNHETLYTKSVLDGITSVIFTSTMGIGVILSAISVFIYQGAITVLASSHKNLLTDPIVREMSAVGSLLIVGIGFNLLGAAKVKVANLLPAVFVPFVYGIIQLFIL